MVNNFSIITTIYKTPIYKLERLYNSLLNQTYNYWEWIVYDDSPTGYKESYDHISKLAEEDDRISLYSDDKNCGIIGEVKRKAFFLGECDVLVEVDHDDELVDTCLENLLVAYNYSDDIGFVYGHCCEIYEDSEDIIDYGEIWGFGYGRYSTVNYKEKNYKVAIAPNINSKTIRYISGIPNHVRSWRRDIYHEIGGHNKYLHVADDYELFIRTFLKTKIAKINVFTYIQYFERNGSNTQFEKNSDIQQLVYQTSTFYNDKIHHRFKELGIDDFTYNNGVSDLNIANPAIEPYSNIILPNELLKNNIINEKIDFKNSNIYELFSEIYRVNYWNSSESVSGPGSETHQTKTLVKELQILLNKMKIRSILDIPCGDFNWMKNINLSKINYIGADIVKELIENNNINYKKKNVKFEVLNLIEDNLPKSDLIIIRDCFVHLNYEQIFKSINNIILSGSKYLLITTFVDREYNQDIITGYWRAINLRKEPFNFPPPILTIDEKCNEPNGKDKSLSLYKISDLNKQNLYAYSRVYNIPFTLQYKKTEHYNSIIKSIVKLTNCQSYLELGVEHGENITEIKDSVKLCVGVDINPINNIDNIFFYQMTTDEFFYRNDKTFDIIFIDANHNFEQVKKDFNNSLKILNQYGIIILHDTDPMTEELTDSKYCHDSYKIVDYILSKRKLNIITFPIQETGMTFVMRKEDRRINNFIKINK